jgi:hypothetical protein
MEKLNRRQIIILAVMGIAILYGAYAIFFTGPSGKKMAQVKVEEKPISSSLVVAMTDNPAGKLDAYIVARAEADWQRNPFWDRNLYKQWVTKDETTGSKTAVVNIIYSGYIDSGSRRMAIINSLEYGVGEKLETEGYVVKSITPSKVRLENKDTGNKLEISIQE